MKKKIAAYIILAAVALNGCGGKDTTESVTTESVTTESVVSESTSEVSENGNSGHPGRNKEDFKRPATSDKYKEYAGMSADEIVATMSLKDKAAQMVQPAVYNVSEQQMLDNDYGSILSKVNSVDYITWQSIVDGYQIQAVNSESGIPYLFGQDDVHGVNYCLGAVYYPQNIGLGAANDEQLMYDIGKATADEAKLCHMMWNFAPCLAQSVDPRWGRTYESYGADLEMIDRLGSAYTKGLIDGDIIACAKHFFADGNVVYGTGECSNAYRIIDRGDAVLSDEEIDDLLAVYQTQIDAGVQTIMISHSSLNGVKMHENGKYIWKLKNEMGFEGFIVSDWNSVQNTSGKTYKDQIITAVNSGIDMFMEVDRFDEAMNIIINAVNDGEIDEARIDDAVKRIINVKIEAGIFDDPFCDNIQTHVKETGSDEYRKLAERAVEESLVLIKNDGNTLPLKEGTNIYILGQAANDASAQCGGWTIDWTGAPTASIPGVTTIYEGFKQVCAEKGINIVSSGEEADVIILVIGEEAYAEWTGDTQDLELCGDMGADTNSEVIKEAALYGKPTVACIVAGRHVIIDKYIDNWDSVVMCYLPGSEGQGVANVICGKSNFKGKLPSPWYSSIDQINSGEAWLPIGYGLKY